MSALIPATGLYGTRTCILISYAAPANHSPLHSTNETYYTFAAFGECRSFPATRGLTDPYSRPYPEPALLAFEWVITLDREVRLVWGRKLTGASVLFVMNRYWLFFQYITQVITAYPMSQYVSPLSSPHAFSCSYAGVRTGVQHSRLHGDCGKWWAIIHLGG